MNTPTPTLQTYQTPCTTCKFARWFTSLHSVQYGSCDHPIAIQARQNVPMVVLNAPSAVNITAYSYTEKSCAAYESA